MKNQFFKFLALVAIVIATSYSVNAQIYVNVRPPEPPHHERPLPPSPHHVWVEGEYHYNHDHYEYVDGYWAEPKHPHDVWVSGHWQRRHDGYERWVPGHWKTVG